ncbi:MAG: GTP cyclohydrolase I [Solirubrobacterales bacterium]
MKNQIDIETIEKSFRDIIIALGDDPDREGLKDTPKRAARMFEEVFEGMKYTNEEIADKFGVTFEEEDFGAYSKNNMVVVKDIPIFSYCEHHLALMYNMKVKIGYLPKGKVLGLSKIARIAEMAGKRLQLQERIAMDIAEIMSIATGSEDIAVLIEGEHSCISTRGIKKTDTVTKTTVFNGKFENNDNLRYEFLLM